MSIPRRHYLLKGDLQALAEDYYREIEGWCEKLGAYLTQMNAGWVPGFLGSVQALVPLGKKRTPQGWARRDDGSLVPDLTTEAGWSVAKRLAKLGRPGPLAVLQALGLPPAVLLDHKGVGWVAGMIVTRVGYEHFLSVPRGVKVPNRKGLVPVSIGEWKRIVACEANRRDTAREKAWERGIIDEMWFGTSWVQSWRTKK